MSHLSRWFYGWIFGLAVFIFLIHYLVSGQAVYGDGIGYYAHLHSWYFDQDWNYTNEYQHLYTPENNNAPEPLRSETIQIVKTTGEGLAENHYSPGTAVLLSPFYILADFIVRLANWISIPLARNGYSHPYQIFAGIGAICYVVIGLYFLEQILKNQIQNELLSKAVVLLLFFGTHLLYYGSFDVLNSHPASFFLSTIFFYVLFNRQQTRNNSILLGLLVGLATTVRIQDGVLLIIWWLNLIWLHHQSREGSAKSLFPKILLFHSGFLVTVWTSVMHHFAVFNSPLPLLYLQPFIQLDSRTTEISLVGSLLHPTTGLFLLTPILGVTFGLFWYLLFTRKLNTELVLLAIFFGIQYLIITLQSGWPAAAYGGRMYISSLPFFALVLAVYFKSILPKLSVIKAVFFVLLVVSINLWQMGNFILFAKGTESGGGGTELRTQQRIEYWRLRLLP